MNSEALPKQENKRGEPVGPEFGLAVMDAYNEALKALENNPNVT